jgi:hypothetical protein
MDFRMLRLLFFFVILVFSMSLNVFIAPEYSCQSKCFDNDYHYSSILRTITPQPKTSKITSGFYFRKADVHNSASELKYNEYDWMYIKRNHEVQFFFTLDAEHCLVHLAFKKSPQQIYLNIKRNNAEFLKLICECNNNEHAPYYRNVPFTKVGESSLFHKTHLDSLFFTEEICFVKKGAILKMTSVHGEVYEDVYEFAGP